MKNNRYLLNLCAATTAVACTPMIASAALTVTRVAFEGQTVTYNKADILLGTLHAPFTNSNGQVGFTGSASPGGNFVWFDTGITWLNSDNQVNALTGAEGTMGISNAGEFIYSPSYNGQDSVYTNNGKLLADDDPIPALPGLFSTFNSRPTMTPDGTAYWIGGLTGSPGGATTGRAFFKCTDTSNPATITPILRNGDLIGGLAITSSGLGFAYDVSDNNSHTIIEALLQATEATDDRMLVDGAAVAAAGGPVGDGSNWDANSDFDNTSINNAGNYIYSGNTNGAITADDVLMYNGSVMLREGDSISGLTLSASVNGASINNLGKMAVVWSTTSPTGEALFYGDAGNACLMRAILAVGEQIDYTGDAIADATVVDMESSGVIGPGLSLSDDDFIYLEVTLADFTRGAEYETILKITIPPLSDCPADISGDTIVDVTDLLAVITSWGPCAGCAADTNGDCQVNVTDLLAVITAWGACP